MEGLSLIKNGNFIKFNVVYFCLAILIMSFSTCSSRAELICEISQITNTTEGSSNYPVINSKGTYVVFSSSSNLLGFGDIENDYDFELFLYDTTSRTLSQITNSDDGRVFDYPAINPDGSLIAFGYTGDLTGDSIESELELSLYSNIYLYNGQTQEIKRITSTISPGIYGSYTPSLNSDGTFIAFASDDDITGENPDGNIEILLHNTNEDIFMQLTDTSQCNNQFPLINHSGSLIVFTSSCDLTGDKLSIYSELFLYDVQNMTFTQISGIDQPSNVSNRASINEDASLIAYEEGIIQNGGPYAYLLDANMMTLTELGEDIHDISINYDATFISFTSRKDITGENPDNSSELFTQDRKKNTYHQVTDTTGEGVGSPSMSADGTFIAFRSRDNVQGENPDGNFELFLAECIRIASENGGGCSIAKITNSSSLEIILLIPALILIILIRRVVRRYENH